MSRRTVTVAAALLSAAALSACGSGLQAKTYQSTGRVDGAVADVGGRGGSRDGIALRHVHVAPPLEGSAHEAGSTVLVLGGVSNGSTQDDVLVGASSPLATTAVLTVDGVAVPEVPVRAGGTAPAGWAVRLDGLTEALHAAQTIPLTLVFRDAGRVTLAVPVLAGDNGLEERESVQDPYGAHE